MVMLNLAFNATYCISKISLTEEVDWSQNKSTLFVVCDSYASDCDLADLFAF